MDSAVPLILLSLVICLVLSWFLFFHGKGGRSSKRGTVPPSPASIPIVGDLLWFWRTPYHQLSSALRSVSFKLGPIISLNFGFARAVFVLDRGLAHQALVQKGALFADRPPRAGTAVLSANGYNITSGSGTRWRLLRRNLTQEVLHPQRLQLFSGARSWVLNGLLEDLRAQAAASEAGVVVLKDCFRRSMFRLLLHMCFGEILEESKVKEIEDVQVARIRMLSDVAVFEVIPKLSKVIFRKKWQKFMEIRRRQDELLIPLIRNAKLKQASYDNKQGSKRVHSYVDSLVNIVLPEEGGKKLTEDQILALCSEFLNSATDTTATAMEWIMANLVKHPEIQQRLFHGIATVIGVADKKGCVVKEDDLPRMPYLKAVILEALRRHPPSHFLLPHSVSEDTELGAYHVPKGSMVNFAINEMGLDETVWEDPFEFKPERFLDAGEGKVAPVDVTGSREIKMIPFGAGRRICPGMNIAMLHLEYYLANLVWAFEWRAADEVDMSDELNFTVVMKHRLRAQILPR